MSRPLRSILIGDTDHYMSEFIFGVAQGMTLLGHWHTTVNIRQSIPTIDQRLEHVRPDIIWGHMLVWSPMGQAHTGELLRLCESWRKRGARVVMHDGDARTEARYPNPLGAAVDLVLCNHTADRTVWGIRTLHWPYFAFVQAALADPVEEYKCSLFFAGRLGGGIYQARTEFIHRLSQTLPGLFKVVASGEGRHTLFQTPEVAVSAGAVLGWGRPQSPGWVDVRVFQYPGAGGVLLHDDAQPYLIPYQHYVPYESGSIDSLLGALEEGHRSGPAIRAEAFAYVQAHHSSLVRVREALKALGYA